MSEPYGKSMFASDRGQLWMAEVEATAGDGGGVHFVYVLTDGCDILPDVDAAYQATRGKDGSVYLYSSITAVDRVGKVCGFLDGIHDQRTIDRVVPFDDFR